MIPGCPRCLTKQVHNLTERVAVLEKHQRTDVEVRIVDCLGIEARLRAAAERGHRSLTPGTLVAYAPPRRSGRPFVWVGRVIPFPEGARRSGLDGPLVYVMRDNDHAIRGCYPSNLVRC